MRRISLDNLAFYNSAITKKESISESYPVSQMPFDVGEIDSLQGDKIWDKLYELSFYYLRDEMKVLPSFALVQDYERKGFSNYYGYKGIVSIANKVASYGIEDKQITEIKVFDNAFDKIILPSGFKEKIIETVTQLKDNEKIFTEWGLGEKVNRGKGINILFGGASGTGKTYCGEIIAEYLGTEAEVVSVSTLESKWVGESEKNVSNIFKSIKGANKVLILDEVDSFLTSRSKIDHQHQSKLTNQFLVELERHDGVCVMTTNRSISLDKALQRRIDLILDFPEPDKKARELIWRYMIPKKMPVKDINYEELSDFSINGGLIKNAVLSTARKAVSRGLKEIGQDIFIEAIQDEIKEKDVIINGKDHS